MGACCACSSHPARATRWALAERVEPLLQGGSKLRNLQLANERFKARRKGSMFKGGAVVSVTMERALETQPESPCARNAASKQWT